MYYNYCGHSILWRCVLVLADIRGPIPGNGGSPSSSTANGRAPTTSMALAHRPGTTEAASADDRKRQSFREISRTPEIASPTGRKFDGEFDCVNDGD